LVIAAAAFAVWGSVAHAADPIKIGFSIPLTGGLASNGRAILTTYQMWEEDINVKGGLLGRPVKRLPLAFVGQAVTNGIANANQLGCLKW
jgi:hypothetical protein